MNNAQKRGNMAKVPQPRKPGQTGGGGRINQTGNRSASQARGGRPHAGGGGSGKKPGGGCCSYTRAVNAITRLEFRLAARYVRMDIKARLGIIGSRRLGTI